MQADKFRKKGTELRNKMWWENWKMKLFVLLCVLILGVVIFLIACFAGGKNCTK